MILVSVKAPLRRVRGAARNSLVIDQILPAYDVGARYETVVRAPAARVYAALWSADLAPSPVRLLLGLRALPGAFLTSLTRPRDAWRLLRGRMRGSATIHDVIAQGFLLLAEDPPREVVLGAVGAFWRLRGGLLHVDADSFGDTLPPGTARAAWNFHIAELGDNQCILSTETRVQCADDPSRRRFKLYWTVVAPGSGLIRLLMLRSIRRTAEGR
jgi:hypothetical protein